MGFHSADTERAEDSLWKTPAEFNKRARPYGKVLIAGCVLTLLARLFDWTSALLTFYLIGGLSGCHSAALALLARHMGYPKLALGYTLSGLVAVLIWVAIAMTSV